MIRTTSALPRLGGRIPFSPHGPFRSEISMSLNHAAQRCTRWHRLQRRNMGKQSQQDAQNPTSQAAPATAKSIPGPSWLWLEPIYEPFRAYGRVHKRRPYMTQFISSLIIYFVGDLCAQSIGPTPKPADTSVETEEEKEESKGWFVDWYKGRDWQRTGRALFIGGFASIPGYKWFLWLSNSFNYSSKVLSLTTKVTVNQLLFTPVFNSYFFGTQALLSGSSLSQTAEHIKNTVPTSWVNSCKIWPAVTAFMFAFIPLHYRSIFGGVIAIGWQTYLSILHQRASKAEEGHGVEEGTRAERRAVTASEQRGERPMCAS